MKTKIKTWFSVERVIALAALTALVLLSVSDFVGAQALSQGYSADQPLERGMIVQIKQADTSKVEPVSLETAEKAHGVVVAPNDAPATISQDGQTVFVATAGRYDVLASDQNGSIEPGDYVTISSVNGVGMKVDDKQPIVIGRALEGFDGSTSVVSTAIVAERRVKIGRVRVDVTIASNPLRKPTEANLPEFLSRAAENIAGKPVNAIRIYLSLAVLIICSLVSGSLLYSGVRSGIISIGRNPLSRKSITRSMLQVIIVGLTIFIAGIFGVYLLLKL